MSATIVVAGALANKPDNGGEAWVRLSWIRGLLRMGFDVHFLELISPVAWNGAGSVSLSVRHFQDVVDRMDLAHRSTLLAVDGEAIAGVRNEEFERIAAQASLLVNISGHVRDHALLGRFWRRAYVDLDPGYTQYWHAQGLLGEVLAAHDAFFSVGLNVGQRDCPIPTAGLDWRPLLPPLVLDDWPLVGGVPEPRFTTVASWRGGYGAVEADGRRFGQKAHEWRRFSELPRHLAVPVEAVLHIEAEDAADRQRLVDDRWQLKSPATVATPDAFRAYVQGSWAEFSVAQGIYVETNSGWFSDRTVRYLASGRPALVQETGASHWLPTGEGLLTFRDLDEAVAGAQAIMSDYDRHSRAARKLAEECFDSDRVLTEFLATAGVS